MDPQGPSQPTLNQAYTTPGNPAETTNAESQTASRIASSNAASQATDRGVQATRQPHDQAGAEATSTSLASGTGTSGTKAEMGREPAGKLQDELDGEQMRAGGEGEIMRAQFKKTGQGEQPSLTSDLDRKKEEQKGAREEVMGQRQHGIDVDGVLGQRGGPANVEGR
ncbi:MAG: hypothetical protein M4579_001462 [Chaenotheca gracillima]|nr:MAG: hypothetical protein M4579_001462 [Chaenotheca gracillima]